MVDKGQCKFNIGKEGLTHGVLESLRTCFKTHKNIRISVLKNVERDKNKMKEIAEKLAEKLEGNYKYRIIGFTIVMRKSAESVREKRK